MRISKLLEKICGITDEGVNLRRLRDEGYHMIAHTRDGLMEVYRKNDVYLVYDSATDQIKRQIKTK